LEQQLDNSASALFETADECAHDPAGNLRGRSAFPAVTDEISSLAWLDEAGIEIVRATRTWIQYGAVGFAVLCIVIGAVEALFGR
jgi:hypothetical protein